MQAAALPSVRERIPGVSSGRATNGSVGALTDEQLINRVRTGDRTAFDALIRRYERTINGIAYRMAGNYDDAAEVVAETYVRIFRAIGTFQSAVTLRAWISRIVANVYFDMRRRRQRRPAVSLDALVEKAGDPVLAEDAEVSDATSPQANAERNERRRILSDAVSALPEHQRVMVTLYHDEGLTYEEVADVMNIPVGTVKSRLNRARLALREMLAPQMAVLMS